MANAVAHQLLKVAKATKQRKFKQKVWDGWHQFLRRSQSCNQPHAVSPEELEMASSCVKLGTAPGYDNKHPEFLKHLVPKVRA